MITVNQEMDFDDIRNSAWGQAVKVLDEIRKEGMEEKLMCYLEDCFPNGVDCIELNELLSNDWEWVYSQIGMPLEAWNELEDE